MDAKKEEMFKVLKTLKILYVEDEQNIRREIKLNLNNFFEDFIIAVDGEDGLEKFYNNDIDIIITDIEMPNLNGLDMVSQIREKEKNDVPVIITTAFNEIEYLEKSLDLCVDGYIAKPFKVTKLLETIYKVSAKIINKRLQKELADINKNLELKVKEKVSELREKDKIMLNQSRYALMGEMIDAIAHQWKQPLNIINLIAIMIDDSCEEKIEEKFCKETSEKIFNQVEHLTQTLDEFRGFFRVNKRKSDFAIRDVIESVMLLTKDEFLKERIDIKIKGQNLIIDGFANELKHVILNIINNSKDAFIERDIQKREIELEVLKSGEDILFSIRDNAGGIPEDVLLHIFKLNFTTKADKGTGVGLYLSKTIMDNMGGELSAKNIILDTKEKGVEFKIYIKKEET